MCSYTNSCCELHVFTLQNWLWIIYLIQTSGCTWMQHSKTTWAENPLRKCPRTSETCLCFIVFLILDLWRFVLLFEELKMSQTLGFILVFRTFKNYRHFSSFFSGKGLILRMFVICFTGWHSGHCLFARCALNEVSLFYHIWKERFSIFVSNVK